MGCTPVNGLSAAYCGHKLLEKEMGYRVAREGSQKSLGNQARGRHNQRP
ncbi:hypothetical protein [Porticoccus sp.]